MASTTLPNMGDPNTPFILVNFGTSTKLTPSYYQSWLSHVTSILKGLDLYKYVDGSHPAPSKTITQDSAIVANPAYNTWSRQDNLILGALLGTLTPSIAPLVVQATTSREVWQTFATTYANPSRGHRLQIKERLKNLSKGDMSIAEYMQAISSCTTELALLGSKMDDEDIISKVLDGLDYAKYYPIIDAVRARDDPILFATLHEKLINHELRIQSTPTTSLPVSVHAASLRPPYNRTTTSPTHGSSSTFSSNFKGRCQWCHISGHYLSMCHKFKKQYPAIVVPPTPSRYTRPQANLANTSSSSPSPWLLDSGATHHITNDLSTLALHSPYDGSDDVVIGDGSSLPISHIGQINGSNYSSRGS